MPNRFFLFLILWFTAGNVVAQQPFFDSLALAKRGIRQIVVLSDYKDPDSSSVRVFDTLQVAQFGRMQTYPLAQVAVAFTSEMKEPGSNVLIETRNANTGKTDFTEVTHYPAQQLIIAIEQKNLPTDSAWKLSRNCPHHPADSIIYRYDNQQRLTDKTVYRKNKLITRETYTYSRSGLPETAAIYDPKFLLSPEGTCVRKYVYLK
ncbi:MAG: hypothetical protein IM638_16875 [Bacteroidetes bacterium]|nr:hypothetical protein [Bacteroidota bacterium]